MYFRYSFFYLQNKLKMFKWKPTIETIKKVIQIVIFKNLII